MNNNSTNKRKTIESDTSSDDSSSSSPPSTPIPKKPRVLQKATVPKATSASVLTSDTGSDSDTPDNSTVHNKPHTQKKSTKSASASASASPPTSDTDSDTGSDSDTPQKTPVPKKLRVQEKATVPTSTPASITESDSDTSKKSRVPKKPQVSQQKPVSSPSNTSSRRALNHDTKSEFDMDFESDDDVDSKKDTKVNNASSIVEHDGVHETKGDDIDATDKSIPPRRKRGRPPKVDKKELKKLSKNVKPKTTEMIDVEPLYMETDDLPDDIRFRLIFEEPAMFIRLIEGLAKHMKEIIKMEIEDERLCVNTCDDDQVVFITLRLKCNIIVNKKYIGQTLLFYPGSKLLLNGLKATRAYQICVIDVTDDDKIQIMSKNSECSSTLTTLEITNMNDDGNKQKMGEIPFTWHIADMDVQDFTVLLNTGIAYGCKCIRFRIYEYGSENEQILHISIAEDKIVSLDHYQYIKTKDESDSAIYKDTDDTKSVFFAISDESITADDIRSYVSKNEPVYDAQFSIEYLSKIINTIKNKNIMTIHFCKDIDDRRFPVMVKYFIGDTDASSYMWFMLAPIISN